MLKVMVTDAANKNCLAVVRRLGRENRLFAAGTMPSVMALSRYSRYCRGYRRLILSDGTDVMERGTRLLKVVRSVKCDVLIPVGLQSCLAVSRMRDEFISVTGVVVANWNSMLRAYDRGEAMRTAEAAGVPVPRFVLGAGPLKQASNLSFPVVLKTSGPGEARIRYCSKPEELECEYELARESRSIGVVVQEYVEGNGCGYYAICSGGEIVAGVAQRRIREFPPTGGPSVTAETFISEELRQYAAAICRELNWDGPLMLEFKECVNGSGYRLIELNPKLWGSLDLTIACGIDVPRMLVAMAAGHEFPAQVFPTKCVRYTWLVPDGLRWLAASGTTRKPVSPVRAGCCTYTNLVYSDPLPMLFQSVHGIVDALRVITRRGVRHPHGVPKSPVHERGVNQP